MQSNSDSSTILQTFLAQPAVEHHLHSAVGRFLSARKLLRDQETSLSKLTAACNSSGLPKSMRLDIVSRTKLPTVEGLPEFFNDDIAALRKIEKDASAQVAKALITAKQRHVDHLKEAVNLNKFVLDASGEYQTYVLGYARSYASATGSDANDFPTGDAVQTFYGELHQRCMQEVMDGISKEHQRKEEAKLKASADAKAQESVLAGAHTGATITAIANKAVTAALNQRLTPLQEKLNKLEQQRKDRENFFPPPAQPSASPASAPPQRSRPAKPSTKEKRVQDRRKHGPHAHISMKQQAGQPVRRQNSAGPHQAKRVHFDASTLQHGAPAPATPDHHRRQGQAPSHQREHGPPAGHWKPQAKVHSNPRAASHAKSTPTNSEGAGAQSTPKRPAETTHMNPKDKFAKQQHQGGERNVQKSKKL
jgi:hypothetical protein